MLIFNTYIELIVYCSYHRNDDLSLFSSTDLAETFFHFPQDEYSKLNITTF